VRRLRHIRVIAGNELHLMARDPTPVMVLVVFPIITIAFLSPALKPAVVASGYPHANGAEFVVPGQATMSAFYIVSLVTFAFFSEHAWATWERLRASQAGAGAILLGKALPRVALGILQLVLILGAGVVLFDMRSRGDLVALLPLIVSFSLCLVMLGVAAAALCKTAQQANAVGYVGLVLFGALGGAFVPYQFLPAWARSVSPVTPTYWAMRGMRSVILDGHGLGATTEPCAVLLGMTLLLGLVAARSLRFDEAKTGWM
jgi:ABC-2 type transport system permease protein